MKNSRMLLERVHVCATLCFVLVSLFAVGCGASALIEQEIFKDVAVLSSGDTCNCDISDGLTDYVAQPTLTTKVLESDAPDIADTSYCSLQSPINVIAYRGPPTLSLLVVTPDFDNHWPQILARAHL